MANKIHLLMPMAGRGSRFLDQGFDFPKPLIQIYGRPFFYWSVQSLAKFIALQSLTFVVLEEHITRYGLDKEIKRYYPDANISVLKDVTEGAVITCMEGVACVPDDAPVVFNDCDHLFKSEEFNRYCASRQFSDIDGILLTFPSDEDKYSFVGKDENGNVIQTAEKVVISHEAICGCYYFKNKQLFEDMAKEYLTQCHYEEYFMSGVYNVLANRHGIIKSMQTDYHIPFGVPAEYELAKTDSRYQELIS